MLSKPFQHIYLPDIETFHYKKTKAQIISKLQEVFAQHPGIWSGPDRIGGLFIDSQFYIRLSSSIGTNYMTTVMYGIIVDEKDDGCTIVTKAYAGLNLKVNLYIYLLLGCFLVITGFILSHTGLSILGLVLMVLGVIVVNWIAYIMKGVVQDRYFRYIHSQLN